MRRPGWERELNTAPYEVDPTVCQRFDARKCAFSVTRSWCRDVSPRRRGRQPAEGALPGSKFPQVRSCCHLAVRVER